MRGQMPPRRSRPRRTSRSAALPRAPACQRPWLASTPRASARSVTPGACADLAIRRARRHTKNLGGCAADGRHVSAEQRNPAQQGDHRGGGQGWTRPAREIVDDRRPGAPTRASRMIAATRPSNAAPRVGSSGDRSSGSSLICMLLRSILPQRLAQPPAGVEQVLPRHPFGCADRRGDVGVGPTIQIVQQHDLTLSRRGARRVLPPAESGVGDLGVLRRIVAGL